MTNKVTKLNLDLGSQSYPIFIGEGLLADEAYYCILEQQQCAIVCDQAVANLYLSTVRETIGKALAIIIDGREENKTMATVENITGQLLEQGFGRNSMLIALGGGIVGDITGFTAGCYQRGIPFMQIPTTLLAQVDASVGGKTGVNHALGKNMIGLFHQPCQVVIDLTTLRTLPKREIAAGIAEIIKYGIIADKEFFVWLEDNIEHLSNLDNTALCHAVHRSCEIKARIVAMDEFEKSGMRMLLNYGHTFGHAIETSMGHGVWLHGEAVGCGMALAAEFSAQLGLISDATTERIVHLIQRANLPCKLPPSIDRTQIIVSMQRDKKNVDGKQRLILVKELGEAFVESSIPITRIREFLSVS